MTQYANLGGHRRRILQPNIDPSAIFSTPQRADLTGVFACPLSDKPKAVNRRLYAHYLDFLPSPRIPLPALDGVDLPRERIESRPFALMDKHLQFVIGCALAYGSFYKIDLRRVELVGYKLVHQINPLSL
jgi:hypothetical protein